MLKLMKYEFVKKAVDFLCRRVGLCFVNKKDALNCVDEVCKRIGENLSWNEEKIQEDKKECKDYIITPPIKYSNIML